MSSSKTELNNLEFAEADFSYCDFCKSIFVNGGGLSLVRLMTPVLNVKPECCYPGLV
ncbi:hypothetical protein [Pseudomonas sp. N3-W]|uniref:hypothetical protein n=1 Tax=Pseudomonas sp. N3-W TaxID=2975049 RepID=UPI0038F5D9C7